MWCSQWCFLSLQCPRWHHMHAVSFINFRCWIALFKVSICPCCRPACRVQGRGVVGSWLSYWPAGGTAALNLKLWSPASSLWWRRLTVLMKYWNLNNLTMTHSANGTCACVFIYDVHFHTGKILTFLLYDQIHKHFITTTLLQISAFMWWESSLSGRWTGRGRRLLRRVWSCTGMLHLEMLVSLRNSSPRIPLLCKVPTPTSVPCRSWSSSWGTAVRRGSWTVSVSLFGFWWSSSPLRGFFSGQTVSLNPLGVF